MVKTQQFHMHMGNRQRRRCTTAPRSHNEMIQEVDSSGRQMICRRHLKIYMKTRSGNSLLRHWCQQLGTSCAKGEDNCYNKVVCVAVHLGLRDATALRRRTFPCAIAQRVETGWLNPVKEKVRSRLGAWTAQVMSTRRIAEEVSLLSVQSIS